MDDFDLLRDYAERRSEDAFSELVKRHLGLVYSAALRVVREPQLAKDVSQTVFADLARKAASLSRATVLPGWLYRSSLLAASGVVRTERRRRERERKATEMAALEASGESVWSSLAPWLEELVGRLGPEDQDALVLRFFEERSLREVGQVLGLSEDAAQKRISRALDKFRGLLAKRGVKVSAAALGPVLATHAVQAAPLGLAAAVTSAAVSQVAASTGLSLLLVKALNLAKAQGVTLAALVGLAPIAFEARHLHQLGAERDQRAGQLGKLQQDLARLQSEEAVASRRLAQADAAIDRLQTPPAGPPRVPPAAVPAAGLPQYVQVPKTLLAGSKPLGAVTTEWRLSPLILQILGIRPDEEAAANLALAKFVRAAQVVQEGRITLSQERAWGVMPRSAENLSREFRSFELAACTNEIAVLRTNLLARLQTVLGGERTEFLVPSLQDPLHEQASLLRGEPGLVTVVRPLDPADPVVVNVQHRGRLRGQSTMLIEGWALVTLPPAIRQVVEAWWNVAPRNGL